MFFFLFFFFYSALLGAGKCYYPSSTHSLLLILGKGAGTYPSPSDARLVDSIIDAFVCMYTYIMLF